jgi:type II secretory pathway pseudopilin PulG
MNKLSYAGGAASIGSALTLTDWGILIGIFTALLTFGLNVWYTRQKNVREQRLADQQARVAELAEREAVARLAALGLKP